MLIVLAWSWGGLFGPEYPNRLRASLARRLHIAHKLVLVTDRTDGLDPGIEAIPMPTTFAETPRCRRRMQQYDQTFTDPLGRRILGLDLDLVFVDDVTPLVLCDDPIKCWKVGHAGVYSGSFVLFNSGALDGAWQQFAAAPEAWPRSLQRSGTPSDQAMINAWLASQPPIAHWTERDGFVTYYGRGYERLEHLGVGPRYPHLPAGARVVVLGSADKAVMDRAEFPWIREHWRDVPARIS
jgi:hypothetical protein